jgi:fructokinase
METSCLQEDPLHPTGTVEITLDENKEPDYYIVPDAAYDYIEVDEHLLSLAREAECLCFGTLIQRNGVSRNTLGRFVSEFNGRHVLLDINLRKNCFTEETVKSSIKEADILKLNENEIFEVASMYGITGMDIPGTVSLLMDETGLAVCVVTLGEKGAFAMSRQEERVYAPGYRIDLVDPCGSGDAFTAAFLTSFLNGAPLAHALEMGNGLGAMVAAQPGATQVITVHELKKFLSSQPEKVSMDELSQFSR